MESLIYLLAIPGLVIVLQAGPWPASWLKQPPLGCPLCVAAACSGLLSCLAPGCSLWIALGGIVTTLLVAQKIPWAFHWGGMPGVIVKQDSDHNP